VTALRHAVASCAAAGGLSGGRLDDFVIAVNELLTNAVRHGGGAGSVALWREDGSVVCEVTDSGHGLGDTPPPGNRPSPAEPGGWGLWLAGELTDSLELTSSDEGTTVRISSHSF
jgi:anti-sigma regulatory factor (Ser/Thr protein kinase)